MNEIIAPMVTQTVLNVLPVHLTPLSSRVHFVLFFGRGCSYEAGDWVRWERLSCRQ